MNTEAKQPGNGTAFTGSAWAQFGSLVLLVGLCWVLVHQYQLVGAVFQRVMLLATLAFPIHALLPIRFRLWFFVLLSIGGIVLTFGLLDGTWMVVAGVMLIGICYLPISFGLRIGVLLVVGAVLAASRGGSLPAPWSAAVWPILASMFMFRLALYLHALRYDREKPGLASTLAYFFMLPNVAFALFPVVDYTTFNRTYYDRDAIGIYRTGVVWIVRGLLHLVLYRIVYLYVINDPADVFDLGDLLRFLVGTYLLYLRVSGQFHLVVGLLHLFGFRLPRTNHLYYLASSFTDVWRRMNIYWKDFMMRTVYYPVYFKVKHLGATKALVIATIVVFFTTCLLHSYQWFWLRGTMRLSATDGLFWTILGVLLLTNALLDMRPGAASSSTARGWQLRRALTTVGTFSLICFLWSLWSFESVVGWMWLWRAAAHAEPQHIFSLAGLLVLGLAIAGRPWGVKELSASAASASPWGAVLRSAAIVTALIVIGQPFVQERATPEAARILASLRGQQLNTREENLRNRGYYEKLDLRNQVGSRLLDVIGQRPADWEGNAHLTTSGVLEERRDLQRWHLLPSRSITWNGKPFSTNRWGMRDRDYSMEKPEGTVRIALLGMSVVMGAYVGDDETFEALLEKRLNEDAAMGRGAAVEILNFAVGGHNSLQQLAYLEDQALDFDPDVVMIINADRPRYSMENLLLKTIGHGIPVEYPRLREMLDDVGMDEVDMSGTPIPFDFLRRLAARAGIDTAMPWNEAKARLQGIGDPVVAWTLGRIARTSREAKAIPLMVVLNAVRDPAQGEPIYLSAAADHGVELFDLRDVFEGQDYASLTVEPWDNHPNAAGHRLIADRLYEEFQRHRQALGLELQKTKVRASGKD